MKARKRVKGFKGFFRMWNTPAKVFTSTVMKNPAETISYLFPYTPGKTTRKLTDKEEAPRPCTSDGFHFCKNAADVWRYVYPRHNAVYTKVSVPKDAKVTDSQHKTVSTSIHIYKKLYAVFEYAKKFFKHITTKRPGKSRLALAEGIGVYANISTADRRDYFSNLLVGTDDCQCLESDTSALVAGLWSAAKAGEVAIGLNHTAYAEAPIAFSLGPASSDGLAYSFSNAHSSSYKGVALGTLSTIFSGVKGSLFVCLYRDAEGYCSRVASARVNEGGLQEGKFYTYNAIKHKWEEVVIKINKPKEDVEK